MIDSLYVLRIRTTTPVADSSGVLPGLPESDIAGIEVLKGAAGAVWSECHGIQAILIVTKSRQWRPSDMVRSK